MEKMKRSGFWSRGSSSRTTSDHNTAPNIPSSTSTSSYSHPYSTPPAEAAPVVSSISMEPQDEDCPVCLESLSFSFRLPGEKPHIIPECGHALHEACFVAVYGDVRRNARPANIGLCGVCRRPMKVGEGDSGGKGNKLASLTGMGGSHDQFPGRDKGATFRGPGRAGQSTPTPYDPSEDDPLDHAAGSMHSGSSDPNNHYFVTPSLQVRPEFSSITRSATAPTQPLTCIVIVELASRRPQGSTPPYQAVSPIHSDSYQSPPSSASPPYQQSMRPDAIPEEPENSSHSSPNGDAQSESSRPPSSLGPEPYAFNATPGSADSPFAPIIADLKNRLYDYRGHGLGSLGPLKMFDILSVRRESLIREFYVYLFKEALICVLEEKKKTLGRLLHSASGTSSGFGEGGSGSNGTPANKGVLRLKGRIYVRHIRRIVDTSVRGELSLTIEMEDERLQSFILVFKDRPTLDAWKTALNGLVQMFQEGARVMNAARSGTPYAMSPSSSSGGQSGGDMEEFGIRGKAARILSVGSDNTASTQMTGHDSILSSQRSTMSSSTSAGSNLSYPNGHSRKDQRAPLVSSPQYNTYHPSALPSVTAHLASGQTGGSTTSNALNPVAHTGLDLICIISLPPPTANHSTAELKLRVIRTSLEFIIASMGPRDRLSLVTYEVGVQGRVRKTPFLSTARAQSAKRLADFVSRLHRPGTREDGTKEPDDEFFVPTGREEKTDVVTAVNHGLDVVLQRKQKNPIAGMMLVSDSADSARRAQMDLVLARAEAANIPIHSFGYGKAHDPASLWLMSNHTNGTYTFVKDWYDLRDCLAGCLGGLMSIALVNVKLHMRIVDSGKFRVRKLSGGPHAIVSADGNDVHVEIGELRYGEKKEMLVELELDNSGERAAAAADQSRGSLNATDQFVNNLGSLSIAGSTPNLLDGMMDRMIDEVPLFELDGSFYDPAVSKNASRLTHPVLSTVTIIPPSSGTPQPPQGTISDVVIVRRRMELLASDMITRALVLISRKNFSQAQKILEETKRILQTVLHNVSRNLSPTTAAGSVRTRKELLSLATVRTLQSILQDLQSLIDAMEENAEEFQHDSRNFGAQQAMILRDQKSWTGRTPTEKLFWQADNSIELVSRSHDWVANVAR